MDLGACLASFPAHTSFYLRVKASQKKCTVDFGEMQGISHSWVGMVENAHFARFQHWAVTRGSKLASGSLTETADLRRSFNKCEFRVGGGRI